MVFCNCCVVMPDAGTLPINGKARAPLPSSNVLASERRLAEHGDAQTVVGTEFVAGIAARRHRAAPTEAAARCAGWRQRQAVVLDDRGGIAVAGSDGEH